MRGVRPRNWFARLVIATWAGHMVPVAIFAPDSLMARALTSAGAHSFFLIGALGALTAIALADSFINDALPARFQFQAKNYRHVGFMGMAIVLVLLGGVVATRSGNHIVLLSFLLPALFAVVVTWLDIFDRHANYGAAAC